MPKFPKNKGYKSPVKHTGKGKGNHLGSQTHGDEVSMHRHKNLGGGQYKDNWTIVMDKKPATEYAPFKMKHAGENPMRKNFPAAFKQMQEVPVEPMKNPVSPIQKHMSDPKLPDGRAGSAAFQKLTDLSGDGKVTQKDVLIGRGVLDAPNKQLSEEAITEDVKMQMKSIEKQLKNMMLTDAKRQELNDKLRELSTTTKGQEYTDTGK